MGRSGDLYHNTPILNLENLVFVVWLELPLASLLLLNSAHALAKRERQAGL
jgi:hypothetical protein